MALTINRTKLEVIPSVKLLGLEEPLYTEGSLIFNSQQHNRATLILFVQDLIVSLKAVDHLQLLLVNFGTAQV